MDESKSLFASKTFWANIVGLIALVASAAGVDLGLEDPAKQATLIGGLLVVSNVILRLVTKEPVRVK